MWLFAIAPALAAPRHPQQAGIEAGLRLRYARVPDRLVDLAFAEHPRVDGLAPGVEAGWVKGGFHLVGDYHLLFVTTPAAAWRWKGDAVAEAEWFEHDLKLHDATVAFLYEFPLCERWGVMTGIGYGLLRKWGGVQAWPTTGPDDGTLDERDKDTTAEPRTQWVPRRLVGAELQVRARYDLDGPWVVSLDAGMHTYLYAGISAGYRLP